MTLIIVGARIYLCVITVRQGWIRMPSNMPSAEPCSLKHGKTEKSEFAKAVDTCLGLDTATCPRLV